MTDGRGRLSMRMGMALAFVLGLSSGAASGETRALTLAELVEKADAIGIVKVEEVKPVKDILVARARVVRAYKGLLEKQRVVFVAEPTWTGDTSTAEAGEVALLLLCKLPDRTAELFMNRVESPENLGLEISIVYGIQVQAFLIAHSGRGRMPLREIEGGKFVTVQVDGVKIPTGMRSVPGPAKSSGSLCAVRLSDMDEAIRNTLRRTR